MSAGKARLTAAAIVFVGWLSFLGWLAWTAGKLPWTDEKHPWKIVSRPQFLVANLYVVAELQDDSVRPPLQVKLPSAIAVPQPGWLTSLPWGGLFQTVPADPKGLPPRIELPAVVVGDVPFEEVKIKKVLWSRGGKDLEGATLFVWNLGLCDKKYGWEGPGTYVLALTRSTLPGKDGPVYLATSVPRSPGYEPPPVNEKTRMTPAPIYRDTPAVRKQVEQIIKMYHSK